MISGDVFGEAGSDTYWFAVEEELVADVKALMVEDCL